MSEHSEEEVEQLTERIWKRLERRAVLAGAGGLATGTLIGGAAENAKAGSNQAGTIGSDSNRLDGEFEDVDLTDQSSTPNDPGTGQVRLYFKNGSPYYLPNGGSETQLGSGSGGGAQRLEIATVDLGDGVVYGLRENYESGDTVNIKAVGVQNDSNNAPAGLTVEVRDETNATTLVSQNSKKATGSPLASVSGAVDLFYRINNATGSAQNATAIFVVEVV